MKILIQSPGVDAREPLLGLINKKLTKISQFSDRVLEANVILKLDKSGSHENKICEIQLHVAGSDLFAKKAGATFEEALDHVINALLKQLSAWKTRIQDHHVKVSDN